MSPDALWNTSGSFGSSSSFGVLATWLGSLTIQSNILIGQLFSWPTSTQWWAAGILLKHWSFAFNEYKGTLPKPMFNENLASVARQPKASKNHMTFFDSSIGSSSLLYWLSQYQKTELRVLNRFLIQVCVKSSLVTFLQESTCYSHWVLSVAREYQKEFSWGQLMLFLNFTGKATVGKCFLFNPLNQNMPFGSPGLCRPKK